MENRSEVMENRSEVMENRSEVMDFSTGAGIPAGPFIFSPAFWALSGRPNPS